MTTSAQFQWRRTNAPVASSRTDDIWFLDARQGWAVNSNGQILHTRDGGDHWDVQFQGVSTYLRCVGFANDQRGWVGTLKPDNRLLETSDGGATWTPVADLPPEAPIVICGLSVVSDRVVDGSGTNFPNVQPGVVKSTDGGKTWTGKDMSAHASLLVDVFFRDERHGWVVGGKTEEPTPTRQNVRPIILQTQDGGETWENLLAPIAGELPRGEWGWKIQWLSEDVGFVSLENFADGAILKTTDGGRSWARKPVNDEQGNANLEGIGFMDERLGWVGGWGDRNFKGGYTSETYDGGETWHDANQVGKRLNRFRFIREPQLVGYASGDTVYRYSAVPVAAARAFAPERGAEKDDLIRTAWPMQIDYALPAGVRSVTIDVWDRFGEHMGTLLNAQDPKPGHHTLSWSGTRGNGEPASPGVYIYRVQVDHSVESHTVLVTE